MDPCGARNWTIQFRATVAMLWFIEMIARISGYAIAGYYTRHVLILAVLLLPLRLGRHVGGGAARKPRQPEDFRILRAEPLERRLHMGPWRSCQAAFPRLSVGCVAAGPNVELFREAMDFSTALDQNDEPARHCGMIM